MYQNVINYFYEISKIPRPSWKEEKIRNYIVKFAEKKNLNYKIDNLWNIVIYVEPTKDKENCETLILQSHLDMVCVKQEWINFDFEKDCIEIFEEDWFLKAKWTTLWADNWIWIALMLWSVDIKSHPRLELFFTVNEEEWLIWASNFDTTMLKWKKILNLDSEEEWYITISSAWWIRLLLEKEYNQKKLHNIKLFELNIFWMRWWHSWTEIDKNRWNSLILWSKIINEIVDKKINFELISFVWWEANNAIPKSFCLKFWTESIETIENIVKNNIKITKQLYDCPNVDFTIKQYKKDNEYWINDEIKKIITNILNITVWVYSFSSKIDWLVECSLNLWILNIQNWKIQIEYMWRSCSEKKIIELKNFIIKYFWDSWYNIIKNETYLWWESNPNNDFIKYWKKIMDKCLWIDTKIIAIHAGLECWIIVSKLWENTQALSIWPNLFEAHTPNERIELKSIQKYCEIIKKFLEEF